MDEKLFESKYGSNYVDVFKNRVVLAIKVFGFSWWGNSRTIPVSEIASVGQGTINPLLKIETSGGKKYKVLISSSRYQEFINAVMKAKEKN